MNRHNQTGNFVTEQGLGTLVPVGAEGGRTGPLRPSANDREMDVYDDDLANEYGLRENKTINMDHDKQIIKDTVQGRDTPVPVGAGSERAGSPRPSTNDCSTPVVGDQARVQVPATGRKDKNAQMVGNQATPAKNTTQRNNKTVGNQEEDPFVRRNSIQRTHPKNRTPSPLYTEVQYTKEDKIQSHKRKRTEPEIESKRSDGNSHGIQLQNTLENIVEQIQIFEKVIRDAYKPKKELTDICSKLVLQAERLRAKPLTNWLEKTIYEEKAETEDTKDAEIRKLRTQLEDTERKHKREKEILNRNTNTEKCEACKLAQKRQIRRQMLLKEESFEAFKEISEEDWNDNVLGKKIQDIRGNVWDAPPEQDLILPCSMLFESGHKNVNKALYKFGGKEGLLRQKKEVGEVAIMLHSLGFPGEDGNFEQTTRRIYYPIVSSEAVTDNVDEQTLFNNIRSIKEQLLKSTRMKSAIPEIDGTFGQQMTRIVEFLFADTNVHIAMYGSNDGPERTRKKSTKKDTQTVKKQEEIKKRKPRQEALLVKQKDKTYAELLKTIKQVVNPSDIGVDVEGIKKTKSGELLLTVRNGPNNMSKLNHEIRKKLPGVTTSLLTRKTVLHIKDMDEVVTEDEIRNAIHETFGISADTVELRSLRPAYGNRKNVTAVLSETDAQKLLEVGKIKIGWVRCRVMERKKEEKCFRCWQYGHIKAQCTGPDRESLCLKCGKEGHKAAKCTNNPYCIHCKQEGHQSGNQRCSRINRRKTEASRDRKVDS